MSNPEIEYFKRFAKCYLEWSHCNMDRIVADAVKKQEKVKAEADEAKRREQYKPIIEMFSRTNELAKKWLEEDIQYKEFFKGSQWKVGEMTGSLKIISPSTLFRI